MTTPYIQFNPMQTTNAAGMFTVSSGGLIQGWQYTNAAKRFSLEQGILATTETLSMIPGCAVGIATNPNLGLGQVQGQGSLGNVISRAASVAAIRGFVVSNQAYGAIITPSANVPVIGSGMSCSFLKLGSGAQIAVGVNAALAATLAGSVDIGTPVSWDFGGQMLSPYVAAYTAQTLTAASWASGVATVTMAAVPTGIVVGDQITIAGMTPTGYNGSFAVTAVTGTTISYALATNPGTETVLGTLAAGGGALPVKIDTLQIGNSAQVYTDANGLFQWNMSGSCALITI